MTDPRDWAFDAAEEQREADERKSQDAAYNDSVDREIEETYQREFVPGRFSNLEGSVDTTYEIINPSDKYHITGEEKLCQVATLWLGMGKYGLRNIETDAIVLPIFLLGGADEWAEKNVGDLGRYIQANKAALANVLDTVRIPGGRERSSMNDIGSRAKSMAAKLRETNAP